MSARLAAVVIIAAVLLGAHSGAAAPQGALVTVSVAGVEARAGSATIRWNATPGARVRIELGLTDEYGVWSKAARAGASGAGSIAVGGLEPLTTYRLRIAATRGGERADAVGSFKTPAVRSWTGATTNAHALLLDGQPFFPRMVWKQCPWAFPQSLSVGINLYMGTECSAPPEYLDLLDGRAYTLLDVFAPGDGRGVIGYHLPDEPDLYSPSADWLPQLTPSKSSRRVTFLTLSNHFFSWAAPLDHGRDVYPALIKRAEMIGFDLYPLQNWCRKDAMTGVYDAQRELIELSPGKPTFQWIEAAQMEICLGLEPSPAIVRAEAWLAIAGGARGLGFFPDYWRPDVAAEISRLSRETAALSSALLAPEIPVDFDRKGFVKVGARRFNGATYAIAANAAFTRRQATFTVPGLKATQMRVFGEGRSVAVRDGRIVDGFRGLAVHIYIADPV